MSSSLWSHRRDFEIFTKTATIEFNKMQTLTLNTLYTRNQLIAFAGNPGKHVHSGHQRCCHCAARIHTTTPERKGLETPLK